jgi:hypothetical protein
VGPDGVRGRPLGERAVGGEVRQAAIVVVVEQLAGGDIGLLPQREPVEPGLLVASRTTSASSRRSPVALKAWRYQSSQAP